MDIERLASLMAANAARIRTLVEGVTVEQARWKPDPTSWSVLEVICHLWDEEREDFRVRIDYTLHRPGDPWPPIDPGNWVAARDYNQRELDRSLRGFLSERESSLAWLTQLSSPNWEAVRTTPFGPITAGDLLASWVVHDLLHMRQLVELHFAYARSLLEPRRLDYAGLW